MSERVLPGPLTGGAANNCTIREAVSVHTRKIYDSCKDKDCIEDLRFYPDTPSQAYIANAIGVRARSAELICVELAVEEVAFDRGYYTVDVRYYYKVRAEAYSLTNKSDEITGCCVFDKRVILFGSEGSAKIFTSDMPCVNGMIPEKNNMPVAVVEAVDPIILGIKLLDVCECNPCDCEFGEMPAFISEVFPQGLVLAGETRRVYVTLGQFSIVRLERDTQLLIPVYDYFMPEKECTGPNEKDPCDLFRRIRFPVDEFFPPDTIDSLEECLDKK